MQMNSIAVVAAACGLAMLAGTSLGQGAASGGGAGVIVGPGEGASGGEQRLVRTSQGVLGFVIESPADRFSIAHRDGSELAGGWADLAPGVTVWGLTSTVIVREPDMAKAAPILGDLALVAFDPAPGFYTVDAGSVSEAVTLTDRLYGAASEVYIDADRPKFSRGIPSDPLLNQSWHGRNLLVPLHDSNTDAAWAMGYTGAGVVVGIIDGGNVEFTHEDLAANYLSGPSILTGFTGSHATAVAGIVSAVGNNGLGSAGIAYNSQFTSNAYGSSSFTAQQFAAGPDIIDIKNNSWGPADNGTQGPWSSIEAQALINNATNGRNGKGVIYVWAGGNGGLNDWANLDNYVNSKYTIGVAAIGDHDIRSSYSEGGSCLLVTAHSNGGSRGIFTTDRMGSPGYSSGNYTSSFGGTSAASPHAAGVVALVLEANPDLTWRDVQHIFVQSARKNDPGHSSWRINGAGRDINYYYGFGAVDAEAAVTLAETWENVAPAIAYDSGVIEVNEQIPDNNDTGVTRFLRVNDEILVEHVEVILNATTTRSGDLRIMLTSPMGTESLLVFNRNDNTSNYNNWNFTSVLSWDENSRGFWTLNISDRRANVIATWDDFRLIINGTPIVPDPVEPCNPADINSAQAGNPSDPAWGIPDGLLTATDFSAFVTFFTAGDLRADLTDASAPLPSMKGFGEPDGEVTPADFSAFISFFNAGCP